MSEKNKQSDHELIAGLKKEESWAFEAAYKKYYNLAGSYVTKNKGNTEDAKDVFQDTMIALIKSVNKPDFVLNDNTKLSTFIMQIIKNIWRAKLRKKKAVLMNDQEGFENRLMVDESGINEKIKIEQKHILIGKLFKSIGTDCQQLLSSFYFKRVALTAIGVEMGFTEKYVRVKKNRCMNELKKLVHADPVFQNLKNEF